MTVTKDNSTLTGSESERMLSTLLGNLPGMAYRCRNDEQWTVEFASAGCYELTGYEPQDLIDNKRISYADLIDKEDRQRVWTVIQAAMLQRQPFRLIYRINTAADAQKWVWEQGVGIFSPDGTVEALEGFITDITHRKLVEKQLHDSETRFRRIFEDSSFGIAMCDSDFCFIAANKAFCQMTGYSEQELPARTFGDITHPDDLAVSTELVHKLLNKQISNYQIEKRYIRKNGDILLASTTVSAIYDERGDFLYFLGMVEDITERKKAEQTLRHNEAMLRATLESTADGILVVDENGKVTHANTHFAKMWRIPPHILSTGNDNVLLQYVLNQLENPDAFLAKVQYLYQKADEDFDILKFKDGRIFERFSCPLLHDTKISGRVWSFRDITKRKHDEMELIRINEELKEHNRLKNEFVSTVSHEMRTPLCVFKNILSNAMAGALGSISPKLRSNLETANRNIDRLARIVNDFLDVAKMESGKMQLCLTMIDMQVLIREIAETFMLITAQKNICFDTVLSDNKIAVEGDHDKLVQIFTNLIGNAIKFTPGGGQILVTVSNYDDKISVAIHDTGKGIAPQHLDKIFDRFETGATSANSGQLSTGLGLNIAKELVELHHGKIWVESIVGEGSTFTFTLPKKQPKKN